jgi:Flp pilus assembly pilin Flp
MRRLPASIKAFDQRISVEARGNPVIYVFDNPIFRRHYYVHSLAREFDTGGFMLRFFRDIWSDEQGQDIAEYAVMLAVILVLVIGTVRLIGTNANTAFSQVASSIGN